MKQFAPVFALVGTIAIACNDNAHPKHADDIDASYRHHLASRPWQVS
ncbi:MAG: hypothetical protein GY854_10670 [Deltaproteobacteria bacterium]|nr:hypothetical protein [Deltaproteobacteria bacterium]